MVPKSQELEFVSARPQIDRIERSRRVKINWQYWPSTKGLYLDSGHEFLSLNSFDRPDIENDALVAWGLTQCVEAQGSNVNVDILHGNGTNLSKSQVACLTYRSNGGSAWESEVNDDELERIMLPTQNESKERSIRVWYVLMLPDDMTPGVVMNGHRPYFVDTMGTNASWLPGNFNIRPRTIKILRESGLSKALLANIFSKQGYWAKMGNQRFLHYAEDKSLSSFEICYHYRCGWDTGVSFIHAVRTPQQILYFCINYPAYALARLKILVESNPEILYRDFFLDALVADDSLKQWQHEIGIRRDMLQKYEKQYEDEQTDFKQGTIELHRLGRHWLTLGQDIKDFYAQLNFLRESYVVYKDIVKAQSTAWSVDRSVDMCESFDMLTSECDTCIRWTSVYHDRTNIRINLLFHLANQREARTNTQIATSTAEVARQTQRDSASMITIAAVTMLFLPGTFISAILSTTFFDYNDNGLQVSQKWWILPAATIPLTIVVFGIWLGWRYVRLQQHRMEKATQDYLRKVE